MPTSMLSAKEVTTDLLIRYGFQLLGAVVVLVAGALLARWVGNATGKWLETRRMEPPVRTLIVRVVRVVVMVFTLVVALDKFGFQIAPLVAGIGVAGLGIGIALQGVLSNVVAGLSIIFTKPFRVGEYIALLGVQGEVSLIELFSTTLVHPDRSRVVIPNRKIVGEILHNYGAVRQLALSVQVGYGSDLGQVLETAREVVAGMPACSGTFHRSSAWAGSEGGPHRERRPVGGGDGLYPRAGRALPGAGGRVADPAHRPGRADRGTAGAGGVSAANPPATEGRRTP